jgi:hypothetical protein
MLRTGSDEAEIAPRYKITPGNREREGIGEEGEVAGVEEHLAQKEMTRWRRAAWRNPASQRTAAGFACEASDSMRERGRDSFDVFFFLCLESWRGCFFRQGRSRLRPEYCSLYAWEKYPSSEIFYPISIRISPSCDWVGQNGQQPGLVC